MATYKSNNILKQKFNKFSFNNNNILSIITKINIIDSREQITKKKLNKNIEKKEFENFFIPEQNDSLFWCWIIFIYNFNKYTELKNKIFSTEKTYKINFINKIRQHKQEIKKFKIKISHIENILANENFLELNVLEIMLYIEKFNFIFINDKIYYENISYPEKKTCIIKYFHKYEKYGLFLENKQNVSIYKDKLFIVENINKPIKSISTYKAQDIRDMCDKLKINTMKTPTKYKTKKELYQLLCEKII